MTKRSYVEHQKFMKEFFRTERFSQLVRIVKANSPIGQEALLYQQREIEGLTHDDFRDVVETIMENVKPHIKREIPQEDRTVISGDWYVDYEGVRFNVLTGQGSSYYTECVA